jgi:CubicO group peptidase (beta-lactamase class C family)
MRRVFGRGGWLAGAFVLLAGPAAGAPPRAAVSEAKLKGLLEAVRQKHDLPALGAAVVRGSGLVRAAVVGVRKRGEKEPARVDDLLHLGSDTKAMTAWLIAGLVEEGKLSYQTTLAKAFPDLAKMMHKDYRKVTLAQLLAHRAGLPANLPRGLRRPPGPVPLRRRRQEVVRRALEEAPETEPGKKFVYSNLGYVVAAAAAERVADAPWEELMRQRVFAPLKMKRAGFGIAGRRDGVEQPWPHNADGKPVWGDNPPVMAPAGQVHCSLRAWSRFVADHLRGASGKGGLLKPETYKRLHRPAFKDSGYTLGGWGSGGKPGARALSHAGSNLLNFATAILLLDRDLAVLVVTNQGGDGARQACAEVQRQVLGWLK